MCCSRADVLPVLSPWKVAVRVTVVSPVLLAEPLLEAELQKSDAAVGLPAASLAVGSNVL
jgi:hypothetical protein